MKKILQFAIVMLIIGTCAAQLSVRMANKPDQKKGYADSPEKFTEGTLIITPAPATRNIVIVLDNGCVANNFLTHRLLPSAVLNTLPAGDRYGNGIRSAHLLRWTFDAEVSHTSTRERGSGSGRLPIVTKHQNLLSFGLRNNTLGSSSSDRSLRAGQKSETSAACRNHPVVDRVADGKRTRDLNAHSVAVSKSEGHPNVARAKDVSRWGIGLPTHDRSTGAAQPYQGSDKERSDSLRIVVTANHLNPESLCFPGFFVKRGDYVRS